MSETDKSYEGYVVLKDLWIAVTFWRYVEFLHYVIGSGPICICLLIIGYYLMQLRTNITTRHIFTATTMRTSNPVSLINIIRYKI
jgi:hypothetical protein